MLVELIARAAAKRRALGLPSAETNAYRLLHGEGDGVEGLTVDVYDRHLVASLYLEQGGEHERALIGALATLDFAGVYLKRRPRQANELSELERKQRAPEHAVSGLDAAEAIVVREHGVPFEVRLGDGLSTGLFLDQRDNRGRIAREARDKSVLNLFAYTCGFGLAAAVGGARRTVNLDVSKTALARGRRNYQLSGLDDERHAFLARDALEALPRLARRDERFDLVILDPPSYASTKRGRFSVEKDYAQLAAIALPLVAEGGLMLACTNHQKVAERELARAISTAENAAKRPVRSLEFAPPPGDHPAAAGRTAHLKSAWIRF